MKHGVKTKEKETHGSVLACRVLVYIESITVGKMCAGLYASLSVLYAWYLVGKESGICWKSMGHGPAVSSYQNATNAMDGLKMRLFA